MGSMTFAAMLGLVKFLHTNKEMVFDCVPVDCVSNLILAVTAQTGMSAPGTLNIVHSTTSKQNPYKVS